MLLIEDKGQKEGQHILKNRYFDRNDIEVLRAPLPVGDYVIAEGTVLDVIWKLRRWILLEATRLL